MNIRSISVILVLMFAAAPVFSQPPAKRISQLPKSIEPFQISRGKSFNASPVGAVNQSVGGSRNGDQSYPDDRAIGGDVEDALKIIRQNYVGGKNLDLNKLTKSSIDAMLSSLDPHSHYFDSAEYNELLTDQQSEYFGIGATIVNYEKDGEINTYVVSTFPDSTADQAHLRFGDKIVAVNEDNVTGADSAAVRDKVRGKSGSVVRLKIERAATGKLENIDIKRARIPQPSLPDAYILRDNIGYVDLTNGFNYTTAEELNAALKELHKQGMESLILDLRDNPGGIVDQAVKVVEKFVPAGSVIVTQRGRVKVDNYVWKSADKTPETMPLVVLVNENSASASEIVSGALQDYDRALIVGQRTFGKGLVQSIINLPYGSGLTLTTAKYFTPSGRSIQRDYSHTDLYDYFNHKVSLSDKDKLNYAAATISGRKVYGGNGIEPDEQVKNETLTAFQAALLDPLFFFARDAVNGRVKGFESLKITQYGVYGQRVERGAMPVSSELLAAFVKYVGSNKNWKINVEDLKNDENFIKTRLRANLITAAFGSVSATQVLIENDSQVAKAVEVLPKARQLALTARKIRVAKN